MVSKEEFLASLKQRVLVLDGAMGTMLQQFGFNSGCGEELNLTNPELVKKVHRAYAEAGANIIITNTFGGTKIKLQKYGLGDKTKEINQAAVRLAREACPNCLIAGDLGPLPEFLEPLGKITFQEAYETYREQAEALGDADILIIETMSDLKTLKAALIAARSCFSGPIISSMTLQDGRTSTGTDVETYVTVAEPLADIIGLNCSDGPEDMYEAAKIIAGLTNKPICFQPNAGIPRIIEGKAVWDYPTEKFAEYAEKFVQLGTNIVGGCCGTNPEFINTIAQKVKNLTPAARQIQEKTKLCSRTKTLTIAPTLIVGERINPTNRKSFQKELQQKQTHYLRNQALQQVEEGAALLDVNIGVPGLSEEVTLPWTVEILEKVVNVPLVFDSTNPKALELALQQCAGKPLINSVNGSEKSLATILLLGKKYGAAVVALCIDDNLPQTKAERLQIAQRIILAAEKIDFPKKDLIFDAVVLTKATSPEAAEIVLETVKELKQKGYATILGLSNISHGLPQRSALNAQFYREASQAGLDLAIFNPVDLIQTEEVQIIQHQKQKVDRSLSLEEQLSQAIIYGDKENITPLIEQALQRLSALEINSHLIQALGIVGEKFKKKEYFLPQVLLSAETMKLAFSRLKSELQKAGQGEKGLVLFATVENDIHDLGKNIVIALLESHNYKVIDLGVNVTTKTIVQEAIKLRPNVIALSALMTTTVSGMEEVVEELKNKSLNIPVIVGGAVVNECYAQQIQAAYGQDALAAVNMIAQLTKNR